MWTVVLLLKSIAFRRNRHIKDPSFQGAKCFKKRRWPGLKIPTNTFFKKCCPKERDRNFELLFESVYKEHFGEYRFVSNMCLRYPLLVALRMGKTYTPLFRFDKRFFRLYPDFPLFFYVHLFFDKIPKVHKCCFIIFSNEVKIESIFKFQPPFVVEHQRLFQLSP